MEITYTPPHPGVILGIAAWIVCGVVGLIVMAVADFCAKKRWGAAPVIRPDYILGGPLTLGLAIWSLFTVLRP